MAAPTPWLLPRPAFGIDGIARGSDVRQILEIARSGSATAIDRTLAMLHRIVDNAEVACRSCRQSEPLIYCVPVEIDPAPDGRERCEFLCPVCAGRLHTEITRDERECPECGARAHRRWCYAHERRVPMIQQAVADRVDATLGDLRAVAGGER